MENQISDRKVLTDSQELSTGRQEAYQLVIYNEIEINYFKSL